MISHPVPRKWVTLTVYDVRHDTSRILGSWPYTKKSSGVYLTLLADGERALTSTTEHAHVVYRFSTDGTSLSPNGFRAGDGAVVFGPVLGARDLVLPVATQNGKTFQYETVEHYVGGGHCGEL